MTIDYVEGILKLMRKIKSGELDIDDVLTDEMMVMLRADDAKVNKQEEKDND